MYLWCCGGTSDNREIWLLAVNGCGISGLTAAGVMTGQALGT